MMNNMEPLIIYTSINNSFVPFVGGLKVHKYIYNEKLMGDIYITLEFFGNKNLKDRFTGNEYVVYKNSRYYIYKDPSYEKTNDEVLYKYKCTAWHESYVLKNTYFFDIIDITQYQDYAGKYLSQSTTVNTYCDIVEFAYRLKSNLNKYLDEEWNVEVQNGLSTEPKFFSLSNQTIMDALNEMYNVFEIPFFFRGKTIMIGDYYDTIPETFSYGKNNGLLSINRETTDKNPITAITAIGGSENIPYYYPNNSSQHDSSWITPQQNLMLPIFRSSNGVERFYYAGPDYPTPYVNGRPCQYIYENKDIVPSIKGMRYNNAPIDEVLDVDYDHYGPFNDNQTNETYDIGDFYVKIPALGFNLAEHASESGDMQLSFTSGNCSACTFTILKNKTISYNGTSDFPDTTYSPTWICLQRETSTFGTIMPNTAVRVLPGDKYVILNINLPENYILYAENELKNKAIEYLMKHNKVSYNFGLTFSELFIKNNGIDFKIYNRVKVKDGETVYETYIDSVTIDYDLNKNVLPVHKVSLKDIDRIYDLHNTTLIGPSANITTQQIINRPNIVLSAIQANQPTNQQQTGDVFVPQLSDQGVLSFIRARTGVTPDPVKVKGTTFLPNVDENGIISFTNDGGMENPTPRSIIGPQGPKGADGSGSMPNITIISNQYFGLMYKIDNISKEEFEKTQNSEHPYYLCLCRYFRSFRNTQKLVDEDLYGARNIRKYHIINDKTTSYSKADYGSNIKDVRSQGKVFWTDTKIMPVIANTDCVENFAIFPYNLDVLIERFFYLCTDSNTYQEMFSRKIYSNAEIKTPSNNSKNSKVHFGVCLIRTDENGQRYMSNMAKFSVSSYYTTYIFPHEQFGVSFQK